MTIDVNHVIFTFIEKKILYITFSVCHLFLAKN